MIIAALCAVQHESAQGLEPGAPAPRCAAGARPRRPAAPAPLQRTAASPGPPCIKHWRIRIVKQPQQQACSCPQHQSDSVGRANNTGAIMETNFAVLVDLICLQRDRSKQQAVSKPDSQAGSHGQDTSAGCSQGSAPHPLPSLVTSLSRTSNTRKQPSAAAATSMPSSWLSCSRVMQPAAQRRSCNSPAVQNDACMMNVHVEQRQ